MNVARNDSRVLYCSPPADALGEGLPILPRAVAQLSAYN